MANHETHLVELRLLATFLWYVNKSKQYISKVYWIFYLFIILSKNLWIILISYVISQPILLNKLLLNLHISILIDIFILYQCPLYAHTNRNSLNRFSKIYGIHISLTSHSTYSNTQYLIYPLLFSNLFKTVTRMYIITRAKIIPSLTNLLQPIFFYTSTYSFSTHIKSSIRERRIASILSPGR